MRKNKVEKNRLTRPAKWMLMLAMSVMAFTACNDDDEVTGPQPEPAATIGDIVINEVLLSGAKSIELFNAGTRTFDVSNYWLCLGPGAYFQLGNLDVASGSASLSPGEFFAVNLPQLTENSGGLGLYVNNDDFTSSDYIISFVQYGADGSAREDVAVAAGIWTDGEYVPLPTNSNNSISYDGTGIGAADWAETVATIGSANAMALEPQPSVVFNEVQFGRSNYVEIYNNGDLTADLTNYWLCLGPGQYSRVGTLNVSAGSLNLQPGELLVVEYPDIDPASAGLGLYANNDDFTSADNLVDFIQYGAANSPRENVAVAAGIWTAGDFIPVVANARHSVVRGDNAAGDVASDWTEVIPSFGAVNTFDRLRNVVINEVGPLSKYVEIKNNESESVDLSNYWLCLGPGQYARLGNLSVQAGDLNLAAGELLVVEYADLPEASAGLGLYRNNDGFTDQINMIDFVQYGGNGAARENVAVTAGIWTADSYVPAPLAGNTIEYDGEGEDISDWLQAYPSFGQANELQTLKAGIAITEVDYLGARQVEIRNNSAETTDISNYWLCLGPGRYSQINSLTVVNGSTSLEPGAHVVVTFDLLGNASEGLGLYSTNTFANANSIVDFVQYGASGSARESVAVAAGIWTAGEFIDTSNVQNGSTLAYDGGGINQSDWAVATSPTLGAINR